jgi:[methyl-Co(III) methanol-specific corrinoid protein]:coenzyme M methyltransferase
MAALTIGANRLAGIENFGLPFCMTVEAEAMGAQVDLGHKECEPRVTRYVMDAMTDTDRLTSVDVTGGRARVCVDALRILKEQSGEVPIIASLTGPVSLATSLVDPLLYYRALRLNKEAAHNLNRLAAENAIAFGDALVEAGADVMCIADPSATGDLIGPAAFEEFVLPCINEGAFPKSLWEAFHCAYLRGCQASWRCLAGSVRRGRERRFGRRHPAFAKYGSGQSHDGEYQHSCPGAGGTS